MRATIRKNLSRSHERGQRLGAQAEIARAVPRLSFARRPPSLPPPDKFHSPRINLAARLARIDGDDDRRLFDRERFERFVETPIEFLGVHLLRAREGRADEQDDLPLGRRLRGERFGELRQGATPHRFENLGQFARQRRLARAENVGEILQGLGNALRRYEKDQRAGNRAERRNPLAPRRRFWRQETFEEEAVRRQAGDDSAVRTAEAPGTEVTGRPSASA